MFRVMKILSVLLFTISCTSKGPAPAEMLAAAKALDQKHVAAFNSRDIDAFMAVRLSDASLAVLDEDEFIFGWQNYKDAIQKFLASKKSIEFAFTEARNIIAGDQVLGQHKWHEVSVRNDGKRKVSTGLHSDVKALRDGKWVIVAETWVELTPKPGADAQKALEGFENRAAQAYNAKNPDGFFANYADSPDLVVVDAGQLHHGSVDFKEALTKQMMGKKEGSKFEYTETHNEALGDVVLGWGKWSFVDAPGAKAEPYNGYYTNVKVWRDGKWVTIMDHFSSAKK